MFELYNFNSYFKVFDPFQANFVYGVRQGFDLHSFACRYPVVSVDSHLFKTPFYSIELS